jgi:hypothetical protein
MVVFLEKEKGEMNWYKGIEVMVVVKGGDTTSKGVSGDCTR